MTGNGAKQILSMIDNSHYNSDSVYSFNGVNVPRVTEILSAMLHEQYLMEWSNAMGLYKHTKYQDILDTAADIGTYVHKSIEVFLSEDKIDDVTIPYDISTEVGYAFNSFLEWWDIIESTDHEILLQEHTLVCKYFGGTLDLFVKINNKKYIVDFKTSNHSSYKHFLQLSAYRYMLEENGENVDGVIILMLDKKICKFTEYVLDFNIKEHLLFMDKCEETFLSLVYSYYNRYTVENMFKEVFGGNKSNGGAGHGFAAREIFKRI